METGTHSVINCVGELPDSYLTNPKLYVTVEKLPGMVYFHFKNYYCG
jgi:hypothetical protein